MTVVWILASASTYFDSKISYDLESSETNFAKILFSRSPSSLCSIGNVCVESGKTCKFIYSETADPSFACSSKLIGALELSVDFGEYEDVEQLSRYSFCCSGSMSNWLFITCIINLNYFMIKT